MNYLRRRCTWNIEISPLTKITKLMPASYLFPFIPACWERNEISYEVILISLWTQTDFGRIFKIIQVYERYAGADPGEVKRVNFHPPFSEPPSLFLFFLSLKYWLVLIHYYKNSPPILKSWIRACYDDGNKMQIEQHWVIPQTVPYSVQRNWKQQVLRRNNRTWRMAKWDFAWILTLERKCKTQGWMP